MNNYITIFLTFLMIFTFTNQQSLKEIRENYYTEELSKRQVRHLANLSNTTHINEVLDNICIPRVVGTRNHDEVRKYIMNQMTDLGWDVEDDVFNDKTPNFGTLTFHNIIASLNPNAERFLVLACHYDSKYYKENNFVGATDSAVPCAMMINLAYVMQKQLSRAKSKTDLSLKFIFFDGEEAFVSWGPTDSIYGARHLAKNMQKTQLLAKSGEQITDLDRIDILVLLDLIGTPDPSFYGYFQETNRWHLRLSDAEVRLANAGLLKKYSRNSEQTYFKPVGLSAHIEDDHIPFLLKGVPILHVIPTPFPRVWHTPKDNRNAIDITTTENINKILRVFVAEYLHLSVKS